MSHFNIHFHLTNSRIVWYNINVHNITTKEKRMNVVIYARFSSHNQTEQSIEGQLKVCYEYAASNGYTVIREYIDRAISGTTDNRAEFQQMISDSDNHLFQGVLVYQLDRFARNRYDSAIHKAKLKKNGVRVLSAKENISDDASGVLIEGVLESMAEYYSVELSQKIHRGMELNAQKCLSNGSNAGLGFKVDSERRFYVDENEAKIVREIFERYAEGESNADIVRDLNERKLTTSLGREFNKNSLNRILTNKRYIGYYIYKGEETPNGMPRIVSDELFFRVQKRISDSRKAPAHVRNYKDFLLTTKLFCGKCKEPMSGYGGTGKLGKRYYYYICNNAKKKKCDRKMINRDLIEKSVINACINLLTDEKIQFIANEIMSICEKDRDLLSVKKIKNAIKEADTAIENLWKALESGSSVEMITARINSRELEKQELEKQLEKEMRKQVGFDYIQVLTFLRYLKNLPEDSDIKHKGIVGIFVNAIYLYEDYYTIILNVGSSPLTIENIPLNSIENAPDDVFIQGSLGGANEAKGELFFFNGGFAVRVWL